MTDPHIEPGRSALLIMDAQQSITAMLPDADAFLAGLARARASARERGVEVVYVRVALSEEDTASVPEQNVRFAQSAASGRLADGATGTQIDPRIAPGEGELVVRKRRVGALSTTDLDERLRQRGIDTLILCGIATSGVMLSTVRDAADRDYRLFVLEDGCFDADPEVHRVLTQKVFPRQATVISIDELPALLTGV
jgi:nicotinamidase-related amidase